MHPLFLFKRLLKNITVCHKFTNFANLKKLIERPEGGINPINQPLTNRDPTFERLRIILPRHFCDKKLYTSTQICLHSRLSLVFFEQQVLLLSYRGKREKRKQSPCLMFKVNPGPKRHKSRLKIKNIYNLERDKESYFAQPSII